MERNARIRLLDGNLRARVEADVSQTVKSTTLAQTSSTTDVPVTDMAVTPIAGRYKITCNTSSLLSANGSLFFSLYVGGVKVADSEGQRTRPNNTMANVRMDWIYFDDVVVNGSQAIEIYWRVGVGTGSVFDRQLSITRIF